MNASSTLQIHGHGMSGSSRPAPNRPAAGTRLRLTRRGRFVFLGIPLMLAAVVVLLLLGVFTSPAKAATMGDGAVGTRAEKVTVLSGQTLWSIASDSDPSRDPRDVVSEIVELNGLATSVVQPGQQLFIPSHS